MYRMFTGAAFAAAIALSPAMAANTTTAADYAARCTSLAAQWQTAETANASNKNLGRAKADAAKGEKLCKSAKASDEKKGAADYEAALKLLGVTPS